MSLNGLDEQFVKRLREKGGERIMELLKRLVIEEEGQGLVEYTLIVLLVALVFWVAVKGTGVDDALKNAWGDIVGCLNDGTTGTCAGS